VSRAISGDVHVAVGGDFAYDQDQPCSGGRLARDPTVRVLLDDGIQHGIRYLVAQLVRVTLGDRLRGEKGLF